MYVTHEDKVKASQGRITALGVARKRAHAAVRHLYRSGHMSKYTQHMHGMRIETSYTLALCAILAE